VFVVVVVLVVVVTVVVVVAEIVDVLGVIVEVADVVVEVVAFEVVVECAVVVTSGNSDPEQLQISGGQAGWMGWRQDQAHQ
jgi:hypothetical protein